MTQNGPVARCQKAEFLRHQLLVTERSDGKWQTWIEGKQSLPRGTPGTEFGDEREAKIMIHLLAHQHIEGSSVCKCDEELVWQITSEQEPRRAVERFDYGCEVRWNQGTCQGRIANLCVDGAFILAADPSPADSVLDLAFEILGVRIKTHGQVVHRRPNLGMGVRFLDMSPPGRKAIEDLARQLERG